jgi:hypothetical protein
MFKYLNAHYGREHTTYYVPTTRKDWWWLAPAWVVTALGLFAVLDSVGATLSADSQLHTWGSIIGYVAMLPLISATDQVYVAICWLGDRERGTRRSTYRDLARAIMGPSNGERQLTRQSNFYDGYISKSWRLVHAFLVEATTVGEPRWMIHHLEYRVTLWGVKVGHAILIVDKPPTHDEFLSMVKSVSNWGFGLDQMQLRSPFALQCASAVCDTLTS